MDDQRFDQLIRAMTAGLPRRSVLRRAAGLAITSPVAFLGWKSAAADGEKDKGKSKDKGEGQGNQGQGNQGVAVGAGGRDVGHPCAGNQTCRTGLYCWPTGPGSVPRCTTEPPVICVENCDQIAQQTLSAETTRTVLVENQEFFGRPPTYWIDVACNFDAPLYRTICKCTALGEPGAPPVKKITLSTADICAYVISEETRREKQTLSAANTATGGQASAGTGGVAVADASGGTVNVGEVRGENEIAIDASGGTANADASGGDNNVAIAGGGQAGARQAEQTVELSTLELTLEGHVVPGKTTTYWVDTDQGRRPATGPALVQVEDEPAETGAIIAEARLCDIAEPQQGYDWFGQCTTPAVDMQFSLYPESGDAGPLATQATSANGRARFGALEPGTYQLQPEGTIWCYAESDNVDANGNVLVEAGLESHVWSFVCGGSGGS